MSDQSTTELIRFTLNGQEVAVPKGTTVYQAAKNLGIDIPIFCYQDRMPPFGACRVCLVEVEKMPKLQASCTLTATEGMVVNTQSEMAAQGRQEILEFLLINHPLDCPICDKGGECPLQDQAYKFGPGESRFFEDKRRFKKPLPLGPVLMLDRERCIACARCTRFSDIVAGDHALEFIERGYRTEVGTPDGAPVDSKFIGNTIMICPVGALTSQVYRFRARPWDNMHTPGTCTLCPVGCSMVFDSRDGELMRTRSCEDKELNDIWLCDKGWFGYEFVDSKERLDRPLVRREGKLSPATWEEALALISTHMKQAKISGKAAGWGGDALTFEENYLFQKLFREGVGVNHLDHRIGQPLFELGEEGLPPGLEMRLGEIPHLDYAVVLGTDLTEEFPVVWLRLKEAINNGAKVFYFGHFRPEIHQYFSKIVLHAPGDELSALEQHLPKLPEGKGALFVGRQYLYSGERREIVERLQGLTTSEAKLHILEGRGNSRGARLAGMRPDAGPFGAHVAPVGKNYLEVLREASVKGWDFIYVAGANPSAQVPKKLWQEARERLRFLVVQDLFLSETAQEADVVLPCLSYVEKEGTFVNIEGVLQKLHPAKELPHEVFSDGVIFSRIAQQLNIPLTLDRHFTDRCSQQKLHNAHVEKAPTTQKEKQGKGPLRASFSVKLFDQGVRMRHNPHVAALAKQGYALMHPEEAKKHGIAHSERVVIRSKEGEVSAYLMWDEGVALGTVVLPLGFTDIPVHDLAAQLLNGLDVEIKRD